MLTRDKCHRLTRTHLRCTEPSTLTSCVQRWSTVQLQASTLHCRMKHSTAQHSTAQHSTAQHSTAQHSTAQHSMPHLWQEHTLRQLLLPVTASVVLLPYCRLASGAVPTNPPMPRHIGALQPCAFSLTDRYSSHLSPQLPCKLWI